MSDPDEDQQLRVLRDHARKDGQSPEVAYAIGWAVGVIARRRPANPNYEGIEDSAEDGYRVKNKRGF